MHKFHKIIAVSEQVASNAIFLKKHQDKYVIIPNVIDKKNVIKKSKEFNTKKYDLIYVGRLSSIKRPELLIDIIDEVRKDRNDISACIIGSGDLEDKIKKLIKEKHLSKNIDLLGFCSNPFPYIKNSKIALLTSEHEGLPMSVIECMSLDVPVLNSGVDGLQTLFSKNKEFICKDVNDYSYKINDILNGNDSYKKNCQLIIKEATDIKKYISKIYDVYK